MDPVLQISHVEQVPPLETPSVEVELGPVSDSLNENFDEL